MVTQADIAVHLDLATRTVTDLCKKNGYSRPYDLDQIRVDYIRGLREVAAGRSSADGFDLTAERARLSHHQANNEELKEKQLRGELIPASVIGDKVSEMVLAVRARMLALPGKVATKAMAAESLREVEDFVREEIYGALREFTSEDLAGSAAIIQAATEAEGERMGGGA